MNKKELVARLSQQAGISQVKAQEVLNALFSPDGDGILASELADDGKVTLPGFGTFGIKTRQARVGTNPSTKAKIQIPERKYPFFRAGKTLKDRIGG